MVAVLIDPLMFRAGCLTIETEPCGNAGRLDMAVRFNSQIYLVEFKMVELVPEGSALQQIIDKGYANKYQASDQPIHLVGLEVETLPAARRNRDIPRDSWLSAATRLAASRSLVCPHSCCS